ncbi:MAG: DNA repair protein RadC [Acidobacteriota bacterium]|nr:DNA repair protein RadC [Acidobacteriota bacterium]MDE3265794.1 DNA repair protein RadC [Acidobacteriota bacterium]
MRGNDRPSTTLREVPSEERPRERLLAHGAGVLSDSELIAILLRTGHRGCSVVDLARDLLYDEGRGLGGLPALALLVEHDLPSLRRKGLGDAKAATVLAAVELARRLARAQLPERRPLGNVAAVARYLNLRYARLDQEAMGAIYVDVRGRIISEREHFVGGLDRTSVEPRAVLKEALRLGATAVVVFHNHPSGDPEPSPEDIAFTRRLSRAAAAVGIDLVDHLVLAGGRRWVSLRERRLL